MTNLEFWKYKSLDELSKSEWESLCDGCGKCCLQKLEDEDTGEVHYTHVVCQYMTKECRCSVYKTRSELVPECVWLTPKDVEHFHWLPSTCAYRLIAAGKDLPEWHPLKSGSPDTVKNAGISVTNLELIPDNQIPEEDWQDHLIKSVTI